MLRLWMRNLQCSCSKLLICKAAIYIIDIYASKRHQYVMCMNMILHKMFFTDGGKSSYGNFDAKPFLKNHFMLNLLTLSIS